MSSAKLEVEGVSIGSEDTEAETGFGDELSGSVLDGDCPTTEDERGVVSTCTVGAAAST